MKKIRLDLNMLSVETFSTTGGAGARGTVNGHAPEYTQGWDCESIDWCDTPACPATAATVECGGCDTEWDSCNAPSCRATICDTCLTCRGTTCQGEASCSCWPCQY
jgi:hypothetical protein